ncbi:MAG: hypothetical protein ABS37_03400 [Acidovorax sp. SCN 65-108]|nr:MAG: hypothetical protein ABS37_03400 [Acidovorax sp. SCN 65-108]OJV70886.1 MAG: hypothetical protein BGO35_20030 [Burkholderiales bacterium 64-34]
MKRLDLTLAAQPLAQTLLALAGNSVARRALAVELLVSQVRWNALVNLLQACLQDMGADAVRALLIPQGGTPLLYRASRCPAATVDTLDALQRLGGLLHDDAEAAALARQPAEWERDTFPTTKPTLQHWLNTGLSWAVGSGDLARVAWWVRWGADLHYQDAAGCNAIQAASTTAMLDWLLAQGVPTDGKRRWDGHVSNTLARNGNYAALRCLAHHGADLSDLGWTPLHRLVALGSAPDLAQALNGPEQAAWRAQLGAGDGWGRTPAMHAAQQGVVEKLVLLRDAGADLQVPWRDYPLMHWILESGEPEALRWWLAQPGVELEAPMGSLSDTPLLAAVEQDALPMATLLLESGADPHRYNNNRGCPMNSARSRAMLELLVAHGGQVEHLGRDGTRLWLGQPLWDEREPGWLVTCTPDEFRHHHTPRPGRHNGEDVTTAFLVAMIESGESAYGAGEAFGLNRSFSDTPWQHIWNADRFGQSLTGLPDGRWVQIGGEHEDGYDPDFFIYADVIVHTPPSEPGGAWDRRVFAYPEDVFPPTDSHTATLVDGRIIVIGCLGYPAHRRPGETPVYALDTNTFQFQRLECMGTAPGWLHKHQAQLVAPGVVEVWGGERCTGANQWQAVPGRWRLDLARLQWQAAEG